MATFFRPRKTFADYVAVMLCPLLIMLLVGSLALFLLQVGYSGNYQDRMRWIICWFVFGIVLLSRVSIEQGSDTAGFLGLILALAIGYVSQQFVKPPYIAWGILAFIWWCTSKLTWDCTLIDDEEDASGEGLLQAGGLQKSRDADEATDEPVKPEDKRKAKWRKKFGNRANKSGKAHAPGTWVIYFSLAALPLFGVGQAMLPRDNSTMRDYGFKLLWLYVAAALGLLLLTSFLGLRRYLRQRGIQMPGAVSVTWVGLGTVLAAAILFICLVIPRPDGAISTELLSQRFESIVVQASKYAPMGGKSGEGDGKRIGEKDEQSLKQPDEPKMSKEKADGEVDGKDQSKEGKGKARQGGSQAEKEGGTQKGPDGSTGGDQGNTEREHEMKGGTIQPDPSQATTPTWLKWLIAGIVALVILGFLTWKRKALLAMLRRFLDFWRRLFGGKAVTAVTGSPAPFKARPFAEFQDPFSSGADSQMTPDDLIAYTFEALCAWAAEHKSAHHPDDTPIEFAEGLGLKYPPMMENLRAVGNLYAQTAYAGHSPTTDELKPARRLWRQMTESAGSHYVPSEEPAEVAS